MYKFMMVIQVIWAILFFPAALVLVARAYLDFDKASWEDRVMDFYAWPSFLAERSRYNRMER